MTELAGRAPLVGAPLPLRRGRLWHHGRPQGPPLRKPIPFNFLYGRPLWAPAGPYDVRRLWHNGRPQGPPLRKTHSLQYNSLLAIRAPSASACSFAHTMLAWISFELAKVAKPQSEPAITFSRPT